MSQHEDPIWHRILLRATEALVGLYVVLDDILAPVLAPVVRWIVRFPLVLRLQQLAAELPPYGVLALMALPFVIGEPAKLYGLYLLGTGRWVTGLVVLGVAYLVTLVLVERVYVAGKAKLRTIRWFVVVMDWLIVLRDRIHAWARSMPIWTAAKRILRQIRSSYPEAKRRVLDALEWLRLRLRQG